MRILIGVLVFLVKCLVNAMCRRGSLVMTTPKNFAQIGMKSLLGSFAALRPLGAAAATAIGVRSLTIQPESARAVTTAEDLASADITKTIMENRKLLSDEFEISFDQESLGIGLQENGYKGFPVTTVNKIIDSSLLERCPELREGAVITRVGKDAVDGKPLKLIAGLVKEAPRPLILRFRDPSMFFEQLDSAKGKPRRVVSTSYLPANARDAGAAEQIITVQRLALPDANSPERQRSVVYLDAVEFQYVAQLADTQLVDEDYLNDDTKIESLPIVDSSAVRSPPGSSGKTIYYVVGQMSGPIGLQIPPGWDLTLRGMVKGEKRRIVLPYTVAYDRKGSKDKTIPPFATVIYTVKMVDIT